jgi:hypothetical protein
MKMQGTGIAVLALAVVAAPAFGDILYESAMDSGADWTVNATSDTAYQFGWDFTSMGIPASPGGSTTGLRMAANISSGAAHEIVASPTDFMVSGQYVVEFDFWINANGPFPDGGSGSTEFLGGGVGYDGTSATRSGALLIITGEGGSSRDWRMYKDTAEQFVESGQYDIESNNNWDPELSAHFPGLEAPLYQQTTYPQQTGATNPGCGGFAWHHMTITVDSDLGTANFDVDGLSIGTLDTSVGSPVSTSGYVQVMYADLFSSVSDNEELSFGVIDNFVVTPEPASLMLLAVAGVVLSRRR